MGRMGSQSWELTQNGEEFRNSDQGIAVFLNNFVFKIQMFSSFPDAKVIN